MFDWLALFLFACLLAARSASAQGSNSFPDLNEVFQGRAFTNEFAKDVFFLRQIRERYPEQWQPLLEANISPGECLISPEKLRRFVEEVGVAGEGSDDPVASTNLAAVVCDPQFYTNAAQPEIQRAVVSSLIKIGPKGRRALAEAFTPERYRTDPEGLGVLAGVIGKTGVADKSLEAALAATAFAFTTDNAGWYPSCTRGAVSNLLCLTNGAETVGAHFNTNEIFGDPGRFQAALDGVGEAPAPELRKKFAEIVPAIKARLGTLATNAYRDELADVEARMEAAVNARGH